MLHALDKCVSQIDGSLLDDRARRKADCTSVKSFEEETLHNEIESALKLILYFGLLF